MLHLGPAKGATTDRREAHPRCSSPAPLPWASDGDIGSGQYLFCTSHYAPFPYLGVWEIKYRLLIDLKKYRVIFAPCSTCKNEGFLQLDVGRINMRSCGPRDGVRWHACMAHGAHETCFRCMVMQQTPERTVEPPTARDLLLSTRPVRCSPRDFSMLQRVDQCWQPAAFSHISRLRDRERKHVLAVTPRSRPFDWLLWRGVECRFKIGPDRPAPKRLNLSAFDQARRGHSIKANFDFWRSCLASRKISEQVSKHCLAAVKNGGWFVGCDFVGEHLFSPPQVWQGAAAPCTPRCPRLLNF